MWNPIALCMYLDPHTLRVRRVDSNNINNSFAGADTTAIAINSILYYLMKNPKCYEKLQTEIDSAIADGNLSMQVGYAESIKLPYLKGCVNEGMRLHPSVGLTMPRMVPSGGTIISGVNIPAGYRIGMNPAVVQYDKGVFGVDAEVFNPDRWIEGDAAQMEKAMLQFGAGTRTCLGKNVSFPEIYWPHRLDTFIPNG
jgi:cytochrome P450